jgi:hypothetical protein
MPVGSSCSFTGVEVPRHGWSIGSRLAGSLVLFLLSLGLQLVTAVPAFAASLTVSPASGQAGTTVQVVGEGFPIAFPVALCWDGSGCSDLGTVISGAGSTFSVTVTVPSDAVAGAHQITACRLGSQTCATAVFNVLPNGTTTSTTSPVTTTTSPVTTTTTPTTTSRVATTTTLSTNTTSTAASISPSTTRPITPTTDATGTTTSTIPAVGGPIGATTTTTTPEGGIGYTPPPTPTSADGDDQGPGAAGVDGEGDLLFIASSPVGNETFVGWLRSWLSSSERESSFRIPTTLKLPSEGLVSSPSEEAVNIPTRPVSALARWPLWSKAAVLSAAVAALIFVIPLVARWVWRPSEEQRH